MAFDTNKVCSENGIQHFFMEPLYDSIQSMKEYKYAKLSLNFSISDMVKKLMLETC